MEPAIHLVIPPFEGRAWVGLSFAENTDLGRQMK
jgi:hypothetical protein